MNNAMVSARRERITLAVARSIGEARRRAGLTQAQVAEYLGIGPEAVSRIERGAIEPTVTRLVELAEVLGCSVGDLMVPPSDIEADQARMMARIIGGLSASNRQHVIDVANLVASHLRKLGGNDRQGSARELGR